LKALCLTVDVDRDVNICIDGQLAAGSIDRGLGASPRFASTSKGLALLSELLDEIGMKATFFAEARTLETIECSNYLDGHEVGMHGLDHEDLTGCNDVALTGDMIVAILDRASQIVTDTVGTKPRCFRAPYMKTDDFVMGCLPGLGIEYDSSLYAPLSECLIPEKLDNGVTEVRVADDLDSEGKKMSAYLWPMHEGRRHPDHYLELASRADKGVFTLATHTWHMCESRKDGRMDDARIRENMASLKKVLEDLIDMGFKPMVIPEAGDRFSK
jgi:peptidoglycan/xylan/chitin deacetylase (PgdA/CDA1 family)